jgi:hypothetical protein
LEFIGRKIMNYLTNIINLWKPPNDLRDRIIIIENPSLRENLTMTSSEADPTEAETIIMSAMTEDNNPPTVTRVVW